VLIPVPLIARAVSRVPVARAPLATPGRVPRFSTPLGHTAIRYAAFGPTATPAQIAFYERMLADCPPDVRTTVGISLSEMELHHALPRITVPALVMAGARDRLTPASHAERIARELPHLHELVILPETGHMGPVARPDEVAAALLALSTAGQAAVTGLAA
jgi:pimeloyl-ACP methyl ester carboxylesterase